MMEMPKGKAPHREMPECDKNTSCSDITFCIENWKQMKKSKFVKSILYFQQNIYYVFGATKPILMYKNEQTDYIWRQGAV